MLHLRMSIILAILFQWHISSCQSNNKKAEVREAGYVEKKRAEPLPAEVVYTPAGKQIIIPKNHDGGWYKPDLSNVHPGDVLVMEGYYSYINIDGLHGSAEKPITIRGKGKVWIGE